MLNINDVVALAGAGFSKQEIANIVKVTEQQAQPVQQVQATPAVQPIQQTQATPVAQPIQQDKPSWVDDLLKSVDNISHAANIAGMTTEVKQETTEDILANIINPYTNETEGGLNNGKQ